MSTIAYFEVGNLGLFLKPNQVVEYNRSVFVIFSFLQIADIFTNKARLYYSLYVSVLQCTRVRTDVLFCPFHFPSSYKLKPTGAHKKSR